MLYTIGHSNRNLEDFLLLLKMYEIRILVDVRAFPTSRMYPHFAKSSLEESLPRYGIEYLWMGEDLGGFRKKSNGLGASSPKVGLTSQGFRNYADYMLTEKFQAACRRMIELAELNSVALLCAEKFYWRCHRLLISDYLVSVGREVWHIVDAGNLKKHGLSPAARIQDGLLIYPGG